MQQARTVDPPSREELSVGEKQEFLTMLKRELEDVRLQQDNTRARIKSETVQQEQRLQREETEFRQAQALKEKEFLTFRKQAEEAAREAQESFRRQGALEQLAEQKVIEIQQNAVLQVDFNQERFEIETLRQAVETKHQTVIQAQADVKQQMNQSHQTIVDAQKLHEISQAKILEYQGLWANVQERERQVALIEKHQEIVQQEITKRLAVLSQPLNPSDGVNPQTEVHVPPLPPDPVASAPTPSGGTAAGVSPATSGTNTLDPASVGQVVLPATGQYRTLPEKDNPEGVPLN